MFCCAASILGLNSVGEAKDQQRRCWAQHHAAAGRRASGRGISAPRLFEKRGRNYCLSPNTKGWVHTSGVLVGPRGDPRVAVAMIVRRNRFDPVHVERRGFFGGICTRGVLPVEKPFH
jgi:hypothetical protein